MLLIACANIASLSLAWGQRDPREIAVRAALRDPMADRPHLLVECLVLAMLGGASVGGSGYGARYACRRLPPIEAGAAPGEMVPTGEPEPREDHSELPRRGMPLATLEFGSCRRAGVKGRVNDALKEAGRGGGDARRAGGGAASPIAQPAPSVVLLRRRRPALAQLLRLVPTSLVWRQRHSDDAADAAGTRSTTRAEKRRRFFDQLEERLAAVITGGRARRSGPPPLSPGGLIETGNRGNLGPADNKLPTVAHVVDGTWVPRDAGNSFARRRCSRRMTACPGEKAPLSTRPFGVCFSCGDPIGHRIRLRRANASGDESWVTSSASRVHWQTSVHLPPAACRLRALARRTFAGPDVSIVARGADGIGPMVALLRERSVRSTRVPLYGIETLDAVAARARTP